MQTFVYRLKPRRRAHRMNTFQPCGNIATPPRAIISAFAELGANFDDQTVLGSSAGFPDHSSQSGTMAPPRTTFNG